MEGIATAAWIANAAETDGIKVLRNGLRKFVRWRRVVVRVMLKGRQKMMIARFRCAQDHK